MAKTEVFADGSITPAVMTGAYSSTVSNEFFGRVCIIILSEDFGLVQRFTEGLLTSKGNPDTTNSEYTSVKVALEICSARKLDDYVIYNDAQGAIQRADNPIVQWLPPGRFNPASAFLQRVIDRAAYIRRSARKVTKRMPLTDAQQEVLRLFQASRDEFKLSSSPVWTKLQHDFETAQSP